jgi:quinol monooxygenase YgiN
VEITFSLLHPCIVVGNSVPTGVTVGVAQRVMVSGPRVDCEETTMPVTVLLELRLKPEAVPAAREVMGRALRETRAFDGNLRTDVLVDQDDEAHWMIYEVWETVEHDEAYRRFRAGEGKLTDLPPLLAAPSVKTRYDATDV